MKNTLAFNLGLAVAAAPFLGGAGQARADIRYSASFPGLTPVTFSWETPTFITPPTSANPGPVDIPGLVSSTAAGKPCTGTPFLEFAPGTPDSIETAVNEGAPPTTFGAFCEFRGNPAGDSDLMSATIPK
jgi:hypothetical protein